MTTTTTTKRKTIKKVENFNLPENPFLFEVFELVSKQRSSNKKVEILKKYEHPALKSILIWNFDESVISVLPQGDVPYSSTNEQTSYSGTLSEKINDAVFKMDELGTNSLGASDQGKSTI